MSESSITADPTDEPKIASSSPVVRVRRFIGLYAEFIRDSLGKSILRVVVISAVSFVGVVAQGATIGVLSLFLRAIDREDGWEIPLIGFPIRADAPSLLILVVTLFALQVVSAIAAYAVAVASRRLGRRYHQETASRILDRFERANAVDTVKVPEMRSAIRGAVSAIPRVLGIATETILGSIQIVSYAIGFLVILFMLSTKATLVVLPICLLILPFLYRLGAATQGTAKSFYGNTRVSMAAGVRRCFDRANNSNLAGYAGNGDLARRYLADPGVREYYDSYDEIQLAGNRSHLVTSLFRPFVLCLILLVLGSLALRESYSWDTILPYMLALWRFLIAIQQMASQLASLYRFHPRLVRYREISAALEVPRAPEDRPTLRGAIRMRSAGKLPGGAEEWTIERGDRVVLISEKRPDRITLGRTIAPLAASSSTPRRVWLSVRFVGKNYTAPDVPLDAFIHGGTPVDEAEVRRNLDAVGILDEIDELPGGLTTRLDADAWSSLSNAAKLGLLVLALADDPSDLVLLDLRLLDDLDTASLDRLLSMLARKIVFMVTPNVRTDGVDADAYIVIDRDEVVGIGDAEWWRSTRAERHRLHAERAARSDVDVDGGGEGAVGGVADEDDEDDLDL